MHHDGTVVTIYSHAEAGPGREYRHVREGESSACEVVLPFDSEWGLNFKLLDGRRRRLALWIDGALVTDSLIIPAGGSSLDRFVNSDRRFKFVRSDHEGVADPTSPRNGLVEVKLWRERRPETMVLFQSVARGMGQAGATVEGGKSSQTFGSTRWEGDSSEPAISFAFRLLGREPSAPRKGEFCTACGAMVRPEHRFCAECGAHLAGES